MKKCLFLLVGFLLVGTMFAQSSGNFTFGNTGGTTRCVLAKSTGVISGGDTCYQGSCFTDGDCAALGAGATCTGGNATTGTLGSCVLPGAQQGADCVGSVKAAIKVSSGNGNVLVVRPSAVIGLLTNVSLQKSSTVSIGTSSAYAGVDVGVHVNGLGSGQSGQAALPAPCVTPGFDVTYDARFIQISSNMFDMMGTLCTGTDPVTLQPLSCYFNFAESTVSAHSFDWIVGAPQAAGATSCSALQSGAYAITANWTPSLGNTGLSQALTCVGPVNLTVQQNKLFNFNTVNPL